MRHKYKVGTELVRKSSPTLIAELVKNYERITITAVHLIFVPGYGSTVSYSVDFHNDEVLQTIKKLTASSYWIDKYYETQI